MWSMACSVRLPVVILAGIVASAAGCATNNVEFRERVSNAVSGDVSETSFRQTACVTWGSTLGEGTGNMAYSGPDWSLAVGNTATQAKAGDGGEMLRALVALGQLLAPLLATDSAEERHGETAQTSGSSDSGGAALQQVLDLLADWAERRGTQTAPSG